MANSINPSRTTEGSTSEVDIAIAGGGMVGLTLAYALRQVAPDKTIAIIEQQPAQQASVSFDSRSIALAAGSIKQLAAWRLWPSLAAKACPIQHIHVSDRGHFGKCYLAAESLGVSELGAVLEVEHLGQAVQQHLAAASAEPLQWYRPDHITALHSDIDAVQLQLSSGHSLKAGLLVICEGGGSPTRQLAGFQSKHQAYQQTAVIANLALDQPHQQRAFERFTEHGPIALLPLNEQRYSLVWTTASSEAAHLMQLDDSQFLAAVQQAFGYRAGRFSRAGQRSSYPLALRQAESPVRHRIALAGNSLHSLHPIAGQGFNLALRDITALVDGVLTYPSAIGGYSMLRQYQQARQHDMQQVVHFTDGLVRLFSNPSRLVALGRNLGLVGMLLCDELQQPLAQQAMGLQASATKSAFFQAAR
ncbi:2-octaprenyl-6-methoxyphenyl hydroxylase [Alkalimonas collagenimarina]|uniref:2-octaprenyl-6-methoxyphenyl hydroxylase n=1 Tax=Alkalimonas collagenimarina TaxID=400390 RepID=A0ABT9GUF8_9GAMM|nr:2-octaprenyl-6-methoxyphenyl hydroxylase [Alkalimonas collagenimarina]MDP4534691.1 2-octaprenyl-6-methoxyphenyl hydroxylase [Alkalimonas collagenimarina]